METYVACGQCGTTYWTSVPADAVGRIRRCMQCASPALEVVAARESGPALCTVLARSARDERGRERLAKALERAARARCRATAARGRGLDHLAERHERAAALHTASAAAHRHLIATSAASHH